MDLSRKRGEGPGEEAHPVERHAVDDLAQAALWPAGAEDSAWSVKGQLLNYRERAEWRFSFDGRQPARR